MVPHLGPQEQIEYSPRHQYIPEHDHSPRYRQPVPPYAHFGEKQVPHAFR